MKFVIWGLLSFAVLLISYSIFHIVTDVTVEGQVRRLLLQDLLEDRLEKQNLALGSSTIRQMPTALLCHKWRNRGIGNAQSPDIFKYVARAPQHSYQHVLLYTGENDIAFGASSELAVSRAKQLIEAIHKRMNPEALYILPVKTAPARKQFAQAYEAFNREVAEFARSHPRTISLFDEATGLATSDTRLFKSDGIHLTLSGYQAFLRPLDAVCE